ncbi:PIN domain-containing protein [Limnoraphis robusta]|uniref:PIN domain-containing protein n=1 Tax=Limnoraphis robusta CCNP1315 TaxID=3110306 RepID=A0ABU5TX05_9CYAN|nr:PIN domain-containing protein [Limnoraphis robusta]MEA5519425.1 PIN domain-containing protein [Limnoraphis robusta CCNP1315]MEA5549119.1 PIN domain-containing protein [Limnoraphis robusta CCNP1324]
MNVYVETNFVIELAFMQGQHESCLQIIELCRANKIHLVIPAYSLVEPYEKMIRSEKNRTRLSGELKIELEQLGRSQSYSEQVNLFRDLTSFLVRTQEDQKQRLQDTITQLVQLAEIIPLNEEIILAAISFQTELDLTPQDSIVYASVISHLSNITGRNNCFLNRNSKDFGTPDIINSLASYNCRILFSFENGLGYIRSQI